MTDLSPVEKPEKGREVEVTVTITGDATDEGEADKSEALMAIEVARGLRVEVEVTVAIVNSVTLDDIGGSGVTIDDVRGDDDIIDDIEATEAILDGVKIDEVSDEGDLLEMSEA